MRQTRASTTKKRVKNRVRHGSVHPNTLTGATIDGEVRYLDNDNEGVMLAAGAAWPKLSETFPGVVQNCGTLIRWCRSNPNTYQTHTQSFLNCAVHQGMTHCNRQILANGMFFSVKYFSTSHRPKGNQACSVYISAPKGTIS